MFTQRHLRRATKPALLPLLLIPRLFIISLVLLSLSSPPPLLPSLIPHEHTEVDEGLVRADADADGVRLTGAVEERVVRFTTSVAGSSSSLSEDDSMRERRRAGPSSSDDMALCLVRTGVCVPRVAGCVFWRHAATNQ